MTKIHKLEFEELSGAMRISKIITSPAGRKFRAIVVGKNVSLIDALNDDGNTIHVEGGTTAVPLLGGIADAIGDAILAVIKLMTCHPKTTTKVTCNAQGVVQSIETTTECV